MQIQASGVRQLVVQSVSRDGTLQNPSLLISVRSQGSQGVCGRRAFDWVSLVVPSTGQLVEFPQPVDRPALCYNIRPGWNVPSGDRPRAETRCHSNLTLCMVCGSLRAGQPAGRTISAPADGGICFTLKR